MSTITILLADDHRIVREGFRALLAQESGFTIVGEAGDGIETVRLAEQLKPHVVVVDLMMPSLNGVEVTRQITHRLPKTKVVVISMHHNEALVIEALRNGAAAYVLKDSSSAELVRAVREALAGHRYLSPPLSEPAIQAYIDKTRNAGKPDLYGTLTAREREVLQQAAEGHTNAAIAARLFISPRTVEIHRANLMHKLGLKSQAELVRFAIQRGLVPMDEFLPTEPTNVQTVPSAPPLPSRLVRSRVFISYSHKDKRLLDEFKTSLAPAEKQVPLDLWDDTRIKPGADWKQAIAQALDSSAVAVLLVSPDFLASDFIAEYELLPLLTAAKSRGLQVFWLYASACLWEETDIRTYEAAHDKSRPLDQLEKPYRLAVLKEICKKLQCSVQDLP